MLITGQPLANTTHQIDDGDLSKAPSFNGTHRRHHNQHSQFYDFYLGSIEPTQTPASRILEQVCNPRTDPNYMLMDRRAEKVVLWSSVDMLHQLGDRRD